MRSTLVAAVATAALIAPAHAAAATPPKPVDPDQPLRDGCQRNPAGLLTFTSPEWAFVYGLDQGPAGFKWERDDAGNPPAQMAEGVALGSHPGGGDLPEGHDWYDVNYDLKVDPQYAHLLQHTDVGGALHMELEEGPFPRWAWPVHDDRIKSWGNWIWDCGHWGFGFDVEPENDFLYFFPGTDDDKFQGRAIGGEGTEFHSQRGLVVTRHAAYRPAVNETEADAFFSSDGTPAGADASCAQKTGQPVPDAGPFEPKVVYGPDFTACLQDPASRWVDLADRDYTFFVPAPPKPSKDAQLRYRVEDMKVGGKAPQEVVVPKGDGIEVTIPYKDFDQGLGTQPDLKFGKSFFVGWEGYDDDRPSRLKVTFDRIKVANNLDDAPPGPDNTSVGNGPGEYGVYVGVNGFWAYVNEWAPGLGQVESGQEFELGKTLDAFVPRGDTVTIEVVARECDLPKINPCPDTAEVAEDNDNPGSTGEIFESVGAALGKHRFDLKNYFLDYHVDQVPNLPGTKPSQGIEAGGPLGAAPNGGEGGVLGASNDCFDTFAPRATISRIGSRLSRRALLLRGRAKDRGCGAKVASVRVAFARRVGKRCRFLQVRGGLGPATSCARVLYIPVKGRTLWKLSRRVKLGKGRYLGWAQATDAAGNTQIVPRRTLSFHFV